LGDNKLADQKKAAKAPKEPKEKPEVPVEAAAAPPPAPRTPKTVRPGKLVKKDKHRLPRREKKAKLKSAGNRSA
jgi:hypothetical protein